jgi:pyruvate,water dikinase
VTILPLDSPVADVATAGGKGANLSRLARAGFAVPPGFILATDAYRAYVAANGLGSVIAEALGRLTSEDAAALSRAAATIQAAFAAGEIPAETTAALRAAYGALGAGPVAVRSSATAEDLPDLSFAGQQDTYLNVLGEEQLLAAVTRCWGSLWTARAIGYRARNGIPQLSTALAVVVQRLVQSEVSGVLFTANPLTGLRGEAVIDATFGLGEALVSGQVEPDQYVVDALTGAVVSVTAGAKGVITRPRPQGGVETVAVDDRTGATLRTDQLQALVALGRAIEAAFGVPQDVEWALADDELVVLQSRPITSLFPVPRLSDDPLWVWFSFGSVQGLLGPMTPLGQDVVRVLLAGMSTELGVPRSAETLQVFAPAGERLWVEINGMVRHPIGRRLVGPVLDYVEPSVGRILRRLMADPRLGAGTGRLRFVTIWRVARFLLPVALRAAGNMIRPRRARDRFDAALETRLAATAVSETGDRYARLAAVAAFLRETLADAFPFLLPRFLPLMAPGMATLRLLQTLAGDTGLAMEATRGMPRNVTTEMDLALWQTARAIAADQASLALFQTLAAGELARRFLAGALPPRAQTAVADFLTRYGMRGVGEIDFGQPRWREDPTSVMEALQSYLQIDPAQAPDALFARGETAAEVAVDALVTAVRPHRFGRLKAKLVRAAAGRMRLFLGARESPKFFIIRLMGQARATLLTVGRAFVDAGTFDRPDDLVYLRLAELEALARRQAAPQGDWRALVAKRRAAYAREARRKQVPRVLVSDGRAFYEGVGAGSDTEARLAGSPVSAGVVEGVVRVVLDPHGAALVPGEILVCPGTDPAWTPLFMAAGGLITEVGGMMTHGSVVAREVGIPAVVGVHQATTRLRTGQRIRLDGTSGQIAILD